MGAALGFLVGGVAGIGAGFVVYLLLREAVLPYSLWSSDPVMWAIVGAVALALAFLGTRAGGRAGTRRGLRIVVGILVGLILGAVAFAAIAIGAAVTFDISQREGAYAMGVAFVWVPLGAFAGAVAGGVIAALPGRGRAAADAPGEEPAERD